MSFVLCLVFPAHGRVAVAHPCLYRRRPLEPKTDRKQRKARWTRMYSWQLPPLNYPKHVGYSRGPTCAAHFFWRNGCGWCAVVHPPIRYQMKVVLFCCFTPARLYKPRRRQCQTRLAYTTSVSEQTSLCFTSLSTTPLTGDRHQTVLQRIHCPL